MCGRFTIFTDKKKLERHFEAVFGAFEVKPRYNVAPSQSVPIITNDEEKRITLGHWGYPIRVQGKEKEIINIRKETLEEKPWFQSKLKAHRCLVLADGFYEWKKTGKVKTPYRIELKNRKPFALAGIFSQSEEEDLAHFSIITVPPNAIMEDIHNRMPAILEQGADKEWLESDDVPYLLKALRPYPEKDMVAYPISTLVNNPKADIPEVLQPVPTAASLSLHFAKERRNP